MLNFASSTISTAVVLVAGFVATPFVLRWLGEERYGAFRAASDWFSYLSLLELGIGGALLALLARAVGRGDTGATLATLATGARWYLRIVLGMFAAGLLLAAAITELVPVSADHQSDLRRGILVALLGVLLLPFGAPFKALAESRQRGYQVNALLLLQALAITGTSLVLARAGMGITGQFIAIVVGALVFNLPLIVSGVRGQPGLFRSAFRDRPDADAQRELSSLNRPTLLYNLAGRFSFETDNIIVALLLGPVAVVPLFMTQKLVVMAQGQLTNVGNASWAALAELHFQGHNEVFNRRLVQLTGVVAVLGVAALVPIAVYNRFFVALWVGAEQYAGLWVTVIAAASALLRAVVALWGWCFGGTARTPMLVRASLIETAINVAASVFFTYQFGLAGPLMGTALAISLVSLWYLPKLLREVFGTPLDALARAVAAPVALGVPYGALVWWTADAYPPAGWLQLGGHLALAGSMFLVLWCTLTLDRQERAQLWHRVRGVVRRQPA